MTWLRFKSLTLRLNLIVLIGGWVAFWGYGFVVGDVPPLSVVPGLIMLSLTALLCLNLTILAFLLTASILRYCHWRWSSLPAEDKIWARLGMLAVVISLTLIMANILWEFEIGIFAQISFLVLFGAIGWLLRVLLPAMGRDKGAFGLFRD